MTVQRWVQRRARFRWPSPPRTARVERDEVEEVDEVDEVDAVGLAEVAVTLTPREELPRIKRPLPGQTNILLNYFIILFSIQRR